LKGELTTSDTRFSRSCIRRLFCLLFCVWDHEPTSAVKLAVISDVHANKAALEAVFAFIDGQSVDRIVCLGDIVGYGPDPQACIELVSSRCDIVIKGNHDAGVTEELELDHFNIPGRAAIKWTKTLLPADSIKYLKSLPLILAWEGVTLTHATPADPSSWRYIVSWAQARLAFKSFSTRFCFIGHTHVPAVIGEDGTLNRLKIGTRYLINCGSVGQPRDGIPEASFGILDTSKGSYENVRVEYDVSLTVTAILNAGLPKFLAQRLAVGV
jgi:predicted phosphodiesterase